MPPRTRSTTNQENESAQAAPPTPLGKRKLGQPSPGPSRVLQDITAQFVAPELGSEPTTAVDAPQPRQRSKRKANKAPTGHLAKRKAIGKLPVHHPAIPSSLPPSSPPSSSSRFEVLNGGDEVTAQRTATPVVKGPPSVYGDENHNPLEDEFDGPFNDDALSFYIQKSPTKDADPFGFLAVESKLKAQREANAFHEPHLYAGVSGQILSDVDLPVDDDHPTPYPDTFEDENDENIPLNVPSTPHKRKKRKSSMSPSLASAELFNPNAGSDRSSPSPSKRRASYVRGVPSATDVSDGELVLTKATSSKPVDAKRMRKEGGPSGSRKKARTDDTSISPRTLAEQLESLLPKRTSRPRAASSRAKRKAKAEKTQVDSGDETERPRRKAAPKKRATASTKPGSKGKRGKSTTDADDEEIDTDGIKEKLAAEREARLEYFKKLESYKVEEENVYVI